MPDALDDAADDVRSRLGIPHVGAPENGSATFDGWLVTARGARFIGLIRRYRDLDQVNDEGEHPRVPRLLARELVERLENERVATFVTRQFEEMENANHHVQDPAIVLAIVSREASPRGAITLSSAYRCSYDQGGLDDAYGRRLRLPLPRAVRRRLRPATERQHVNEAGRPIQPAAIHGYDQLILYTAYVLRSESQLRAQIRRVFPEDGDERMSSWSDDTRRAWTQLSFGRGGGGGLVRALRRARDQNATLESIFTDAVMLERDSVKRARVTAGDASLIQQFALRGSAAAQPHGSGT